MARYIRTKDGVYKVSHLNAYATHKRKGETLLVGYKTSYIKNENIIAQSESIEELCDGFVIALKDSKKNPNDNMYDKEEYYSIFQRIGYAKNYYNEDYNDLYGAIWTDKGLIYVAKMDSEGKLELI